MSRAVLLVGHGTRSPAGTGQFLTLARLMASRLPDLHVEPCFLEHAEPQVAAAIDRLAAAGVTRLALSPLFLFAAGHAKADLPRILQAARLRHPELNTAQGPVLGVHARLVQACADMLQVSGGLPPGTRVLLVGRGSSDPEPNAGLAEIARRIRQVTGAEAVEIAFADITPPGVPAGLERAARPPARRVVLLPYFLFHGVLMERLKREVAQAAAMHPTVTFVLAGSDGLAASLPVQDLIAQRIAVAAALTALRPPHKSRPPH